MWFPLAVAAALFWGFDYAFSEQLFKHISVLGALALTTILAGIVLGIVALATGQMQKDVAILSAQPRVLALFLIAAAAFVIGDFLISTSISDKNATVASLVEISYPFFVALGGYLFFAEDTLTTGTAVGGIVIFAGVAIIYIFN